jgi:hypothetical protein
VLHGADITVIARWRSFGQRRADSLARRAHRKRMANGTRARTVVSMSHGVARNLQWAR